MNHASLTRLRPPTAASAGLDERQREAVEHGGGPLLILAGPGSGKTRVLCHRIAALVERGAPPDRILAVTFTRKAAREMVDRLQRMMSGRSLHWLLTFHSLCVRILRRDWAAAGLRRGWSVADSSASQATVQKAVESLKLSIDEFDLRRERNRISARKNSGRHPDEALKAELVRAAQRKRRMRETIASVRIHCRYDRLLKEQNHVDFDDLLLLTRRLLEETDSGRAWKERWDHVLVDECQDTNLVQYCIVRELAGHHGNVTVVGDPDQSIYGWRGAEIGNLDRYREDFRPIVVELDANYRSAPCIVQAARAVMESQNAAEEAGHGDRNRLRRNLKSMQVPSTGERVKIVRHRSDEDEAIWIHNLAVERVRLGGRPEEHRLGVLYRTTWLSRRIEEQLIISNIPYTISGGKPFYDRAEIRDAIAYLKAVQNPDDDEAFERILNKPARGFGKESIERVRNADIDAAAMPTAPATGGRRPPLQERCRAAAESPTSGLTDPQKANAKALLATLRKARQMISEREAQPAEVATFVLDESGYRKRLAESRKPEDADRIENLDQLIETMKEYEKRTREHEALQPGLQGFLDQVALKTDREPDDEATSLVHLMSLHAAKGLEFPTVVIAGAENGICPLTPRGDNEGAVLGYDQKCEERRLFYVGMTRAEKLLYLSHACVRMRFGRMVMCAPSPYLMDVPKTVADETEGPRNRIFLPPETKQRLARESFERKWRAKERRVEALTAVPVGESPDREEPPFDPNEEPMPQDLLYEDGMDGPPPGLDEPPPFADDDPPDRYGPPRGTEGPSPRSGASRRCLPASR